MLSLPHAPLAQPLLLQDITHDETAMLLLRLGIFIGDEVNISAKLPGQGPIVLSRNGQEVALGYEYAQTVWVEQLSA
ncbi:MAG: ferrous iron transport protein A [Vampirovibrionales bacterium]